MQRRNQIPDQPRYAYARQRAYRLLCELEIDRLPVDPWKVAEMLPNVHICKWTDLRDNCHDDDPLFIDKESADAKTQHLRGQADYLVVYDDRVENYQRIRWTIAHEIGHIVLGHLTSFEATALCRGSLSEQEYKVLEREADTFAVNLLAPMTIIIRLPSIQSKADFMELCDLSGQASDNCMEELRLLKSGKKLPFPIKEEDVLHRLFFRFINEFNGTEVTSLEYDDLEIDEMPFLGLLKTEFYGKKAFEELSEEQMGVLKNLTDDVLSRFKQETEAVNFWNNVALQQELRTYIIKQLISPEIKKYVPDIVKRRKDVAQKLMELGYQHFGRDV